MKSNNIILCTVVGTVIGASIGMLTGKKFCSKTVTIKKAAGKALHAAGSFVEHMSF